MSEKAMATHSSVLAWRIPGTGEPGGLPSMGLHRVEHDWSDLAAAAAATYSDVHWAQMQPDFRSAKTQAGQKTNKEKDPNQVVNKNGKKS